MGEVLVNPTICGAKDCRTLKGIAVDTGSSHSSITFEMAEELGVSVVAEIPVEFGDKRRAMRKVGSVIIALNGRRSPVPVFISDVTVIGRTTLESLGFKVDPIDGKLEPKPITA